MQSFRNKIRIFIILIFAISISVSLFAGNSWEPNLTPVSLVDKNNEEIILDNVRWGFKYDGKEFKTVYKRAKIRFDQVESILFCTEDFPPKCVASHIYLTFIFKSDKGMVTADGKHSAKGVVISVTNRLRKGEAASSLTKAFFPKRTKDPWPLVFEVGTLADRLQNSMFVCGNDIKMYPLKLSSKLVEQVFRSGIELSLVDRSKDFYHVLFNNCVVGAFKILKKGLGEKYFPDFWTIKGKLVSHKVSLPKLSAGYLKKKGLNNKKYEIPHSSRFVTLPSSRGKIVFDMTKMEGYARAIPAIIPFAIELQNYFELSQVSSDMQRLVDLVGPSHPDCFKYLATKSHVDNEREETAEAILKMLKANQIDSLNYYLDAIKRNRLNRNFGFSEINSSLVNFLKFEISHDPQKKSALQSYYDSLRKF